MSAEILHANAATLDPITALTFDDLEMVSGGDDSWVDGALIGAGVGAAVGVAIVAGPAVVAVLAGQAVVGFAWGSLGYGVAATAASGALFGGLYDYFNS